MGSAACPVVRNRKPLNQDDPTSAGGDLADPLQSPRDSEMAGYAVLDDGSLLRLYAERDDQDAFSTLTARHADRVRSTCRRVLGDSQDAEDATQETFLRLAAKAFQLRHFQTVGGWLHRVGRGAAVGDERRCENHH